MDLLFCFEALLAAKIFGRTACVLAKRDEAAFPTLADEALNHRLTVAPSLFGALQRCLPTC